MWRCLVRVTMNNVNNDTKSISNDDFINDPVEEVIQLTDAINNSQELKKILAAEKKLPHTDTIQTIGNFKQWLNQLKQGLTAYQSWYMSHTVDIASIPNDKPLATKVNQYINGDFFPFAIAFTSSFNIENSDFINHFFQKNYQALTASEDEDDELKFSFPPVLPEYMEMPIPICFLYDKQIDPYIKALTIDSLADDANQTLADYVAQSLTNTNTEQWQNSNIADLTTLPTLIANHTKEMEVDIVTATRLGFVGEDSENSHDDITIPKNRLLVINMPHPLLKNDCQVWCLPPIDHILYSQKTGLDDINSIAEHVNAVLHITNAKAGLTKTDHEFWHSTLQPLKNERLIPLQVILNTNTSMPSDIKQMAWLSKKSVHTMQKLGLEMDDVYNTCTADVSSFEFLAQRMPLQLIVKQSKKLRLHFLKPLLELLLTQSQHLEQNIPVLTDKLTNLESKKNKAYEDLEQNNKNTLSKRDTTEELLNRVSECLFESGSIHDRLMQSFSNKSFNRYVERGQSFVNISSVDVAEQTMSARNIIIAGIKLDIKRAQKDIEKLNNCFQSMHNDLDMSFENKLTLSILENSIVQHEQSTITNVKDALETYQMAVVEPLFESFLQQKQYIETWYRKTKNLIQTPLKVMNETVAIIDKRTEEYVHIIKNSNAEIEQVSTDLHNTKLALLSLIPIIRALNHTYKTRLDELN